MINFHGLRRPSHYEVGRFLRSGLAQQRHRLRVTRIITTGIIMTRTADAKVAENIKDVAAFGLEGATSLEDGAFSKNNVVYSFGAPVAGKVTVEARPAVTGGGSFFFRAKMAR